MFIISLSYKKDISEVEKFIDPHIQFLDKYYSEKKFIFSGRKNPRTGGIILARNVNRDSLQEIIKQDPFYQNEIADYEITEVNPTKYDEDFKVFIEK
ncbi:GTP cyclohydrolase [Flavobacterium aquariorum]|uniref:GTP cyclohydrolase n=1 Tax=Flavobacterium aquariorum TaxID=2217670 RepID=A0A2W7TWJ6_9FLAO|nr:YciI family protein [Flavobacterium aquariorum]PZX93130.1 GTP cyclohydrolase [Flavobacterium aquariorum]